MKSFCLAAVIFGVLLANARIHAQTEERALTVEAVLRAIQERQIVVENYWTYIYPTTINPIKWSNNLPPFPQDGTIPDLPKAIAALNEASQAYDGIKGYFLAYDTTKHRFINLTQSAVLQGKKAWETPDWIAGPDLYNGWTEFNTASIDLPSVGVFDETNWREKIAVLASNIDHLRAIEWPLLTQRATGGWSGGASENNLAWTAAFPNLHPPAGSDYSLSPGLLENSVVYEGTSVRPITWGTALSWRVDASAMIGSPSWDGFGEGTTLYCSTGVRAQVGSVVPFPPVPGAPTLDGEITLFKGASVAQWGDLMETVANAAGDKLPLGVLTKIPFDRQADGTFKAGSYSDSFIFMNDDMRISDATAATQALNWLDIDAPTITGNLVVAPSPAPEIVRQETLDNDGNYAVPYLFNIPQAATFRRGYKGWGYPSHSINSFEIIARCVLIPKFTKFIPDASRHLSHTRYGLGEIVPVVEQVYLQTHSLVQIHTGRGNNDLNQIGWLGSRQDGFGTLTFHGSPDEFEVLYEEKWQNYEDLPLGGPKFDSRLEFTEEQKTQSGWEDRFAYIAEWYAPRLRQVKGGDVLVDIHYPTCYRKELTFYWAKDAGNITAGFYHPTGTPFKTITVKNPTAPEADPGLPTTKNDLQLIEDGARFYEILHTRFEGMFVGPEQHEKFTLKISNTPGSEKFKREVDVTYKPYQQQQNGTYTVDSWDVTETRDGQATATKIVMDDNYNGWDSAFPAILGDTWPRPKSIAITSGDQARKIDFTWGEPSNPFSEMFWNHFLQKVEYSGSAEWSETGKKIHYDDNHMLESDERIIAGKSLLSTNVWTGNTRTTTSKLGNSDFRTSKATYSDHLKKVELYQGAQKSVTLTYAGPEDGGSSSPWTLTNALYPGGYQEMHSIWGGNDGVTSDVKSGWGSGFSSGTHTVNHTNRFGELIDYSVRTSGVGGILLDSAAGSEFTTWGAPKTIVRPQGVEQATYYEEGIKARKPKTRSDLSGNVQSVDFDWAGRVTTLGTGFETFTMDYSAPLIPSAHSNTGDIESRLNGFGEVLGGSSGFGVGSSFDLHPGGMGSVEVDGRSKGLGMDASGMITSIAGGLGSRGAQFDIGVSGGKLYTEVTLKNKLGTPWGTERTYYDDSGRVVLFSHPAEDGSTATEQWVYNDELQAVTYQPGVGPVAQSTKTTISADGATTTVSVGGNELVRYTRSVQDGALKLVTEFKDDSPGVLNPPWTTVANETSNPTTGAQSYLPWGNNANALTKTLIQPGIAGSVQVVNAATGDTLTTSLAHGLPTSIQGTVRGVSVNFNNIGHTNGFLDNASGTIGGRSAGFTIGNDRRLQDMWWPGSHPTFTYGGQPGFEILIHDMVKGTNRTIAADGMGDLTAVSGDGVHPLSINTQDVVGGSTTTINGSVTINTNLHGLVLGKSYPGISESYPRNTDGSLSGTSIGGTSATITYPTPQDRVTNYGGGLAMTEHFYNVGLRASVSAPGDARTFTYYHLEPRRETHVDGTLNGWSVEWLPDAQDRPATLRVSNGNVTRDFGLQYDANGRIWKSTSTQLTGIYTPNAMGEVETLQRGALQTTWSYDDLGRFAGVTNSGTSFNYTYPDRDARGRITTRQAGTGIGWSGLQYDGRDQLQHAQPSVGAALDYSYDARGNRTGQGAMATQTVIIGLDQVGTRTLMSGIYGVTGTVTPGAEVWVFRPDGISEGEQLSVNPVTGEYRQWWDADLGAARQIEILVQGRLAGAGAQGHDAVAERKVSVALPSAAETFVYDTAGRLKEDGYWLYTWDAAGRLIGMDTATIGSLTEPGALWESLEFGYDADGRRTWKKRRVAYLDDRPQKVETSRVLYAGWLPVMEERSGFPGNVAGRRWFQWGADLSGTREGAGGIGGLVAIIEERGANTYRTLLPVQDGLGNVVGVIDTATNHVIARYDYGPYGEPLGESGEVDACPFRWQTRWYDPETELYVFPNGRPYTPRLGRWLSRDPIGEEGGFNLYAYCGNDPVNKHDPLGFADQFNAGSQAGALLMSLIDPLNYRPTANGFVLADKRPNALNSSPDFYADRDRAMVVQQGLETTAFTLGNGMRAGGGLLEAGVGLLGSEITFGASLFMLGNGLDNAYAGSASLASGHGVSSLGEQAIYSAAGDGLLGQSLYIATQLGAPFALNQIGSRGPELVSRAATFDLGRVNPLNYRVPAELYSGLPRLKYTKKPTPILLEPYGGPGGGHHVPAKSAFIGDPVYDPTTAPAIPNSVLEHLNMNHDMISGAQQTMYRAYARTGQSLTWDAMELIEAQALVKGGMSPETAAATIRKAIKMLKASGVNGPTRIPWGE